MIKQLAVYRAEDLLERLALKPGEPHVLEIGYSTQRPENQWSMEVKSRFIHAMLLNDPIVPIYITYNISDPMARQLVLDGKQRLTSLLEYTNNQYKLWKNTPAVSYDVYDKDENNEQIYDERGIPVKHTETFEIAGKYYEELPQKLQRIIMDFRFDCTMLSETTANDLSRIMYNLNNGKTATATQKSIMKLGLNLGRGIEELTENDLFANRVTFTATQRKNSEAHKMILCSLMLWTGINDTDFDFKNMSSSTSLNAFSEKFSNTWSDRDLKEMGNMFVNLDNFLPKDNSLCLPYLNSTHLPILVMNMDKYISLYEDGLITEEQYKDFLQYWFEKGVHKYNYEKYNGKSINDKVNVNGRIEAMEKELLVFIGLEEEKPLYDINFGEVVKSMSSDVTNEQINDITIHSLMGITGMQYLKFNLETEQDFFDNVLNSEQGNEKLEDAKFYIKVLKEYLKEKTLPDINQIPMYISAIQEATRKDYCDEYAMEWLHMFIQKYNDVCDKKENINNEIYFGIADDNYIKYLNENNTEYMFSIIKKSINDYCSSKIRMIA